MPFCQVKVINSISWEAVERVTKYTIRGILTATRSTGALMIIAWVLLASVGMFIARYTRTLWDGKELFGGKVWFQVKESHAVLCLVHSLWPSLSCSKVILWYWCYPLRRSTWNLQCNFELLVFFLICCPGSQGRHDNNCLSNYRWSRIDICWHEALVRGNYKTIITLSLWNLWQHLSHFSLLAHRFHDSRPQQSTSCYT